VARGLVVAVVVTLSKGYDLEYVWRQVTPAAAMDPAGGYYIRAVEEGGEPPGRWWGPGAEALGLRPGQVLERKPYDLLFGQRRAPDGTPLGRQPSARGTTAEVYRELVAAEPDGSRDRKLLLRAETARRSVFGRLLAAEPHATAERRQELLAEAAARARVSPLFFDLTISFSKSISVFHASLGENARVARRAGDAAGEAYWAGLVAEVEEMIWQAVHAGFEHFQREAGYTRTGSHASRVAGRETGQWREAGLVVAHWLQHVSRDGDMQLHVHSQIAHIARTVHDGKWRAPDSFGYAGQLGAVAAVVSVHLEEALTRRFGLGWSAREDGHGFEIAGIPAHVLRVFSSRRESITTELRARAREFEGRYGRAPSQRELARLAQVSNFATRARKPHWAPGADVLHAQWAARLDRAAGVDLARIAPSVWGEDTARGAPRRGQCLSAGEQERAARRALALAQQAASSWTRADLVKYLGRVLPRTGADPVAAVRLVEELADRAIAGEFEQVVCLEAPEPVRVPAALVRADGRSVYQRHGTTRYATRVQLSAEERLLARAAARGAPALAREQAAALLGASAADLDAALTPPAHAQPAGAQPADAGDLDETGPAAAASSPGTGDGLRADQAAAVFWALTDDRRVSVIAAPAGVGKTRVLAAAARTWQAAGDRPVVGVAPSQAARNTLAVFVPESYNSAQFLGHLPGERGVRGPVWLAAGTLLLVDEASMISARDLADLTAHAEACGAKVVAAGDGGQLQAVEDGGAMTLLAGALGYARLGEPARFTEEWERAASLRLHSGDVSVLSEYDMHGRISGGDPETVMDAAAAHYVACQLEGTDVLLMAADHARRRELSRRIRDDLLHLGLVAAGPGVRIAGGTAVAGNGDLIVCTRNDHTVVAGEPGRTLANGDLLRVEAITPRGLLVRRAVETDPVTGQRRWTQRCFMYKNYADCELGYAVTCHAAQSRTVHTALALITGTEDRQHAYVALTRGTTRNHAYVFTLPPNTADPSPAVRPAPELARFDRLAATTRDAKHVPADANQSWAGELAIGVLAQVLGRDGRELSATQIRESSLSDADHLAVLYAMWQGEIIPAREQHYRNLVTAALPDGYRGELSPRARWLWRTLRAAELAGLDPAGVIATAAGQRSLVGARDVAAVLDARIRRAGTLVPAARFPWASRLPAFGDPQRQKLAGELAAAMDARTARIGQHAARHALPWAVSALGPVPAYAGDRGRWQQRAAVIGAWRELSGYDHPADAIGPEPAGDTPDKRAAWHAALAALSPAGEHEVRGLPDGMLWQLRDTYTAETAWAPRWPGGLLRQARTAGERARLAAIRAEAEAKAAASRGDPALAWRHEDLAASYHALHLAYARRETVLATAMDDRAHWERATAARRSRAIAADAELRRRHPGQTLAPLRSAEPESLADTDTVSLAVKCGQPVPDARQWLADLTAAHAAFASVLAARQADRHAAHAGRPGPGVIGPALATWAERGQEAVLQPPQPQIPPSPLVLDRARERDAGLDAAR
jgi:conjugative relaxase-like TrwC/TraI family protein